MNDTASRSVGLGFAGSNLQVLLPGARFAFVEMRNDSKAISFRSIGKALEDVAAKKCRAKLIEVDMYYMIVSIME